VDLGKQVRLGRIFSHPSGRLCSIAIDHFVGYSQAMHPGLANLPATLSRIAAGKPDAVTMFKGVAMGCWSPYAGKIPLILQAGCFTADESIIEVLTSPEEAQRLGADAVACSIGVRGPNEGKFIRILCDVVAASGRVGMPVIAHIYPREFSNGAKVVHDADNIAWATRVGIECGADVIKVGFTGDAESYRQIVSSCPVPVVAAGGAKCETLEAALVMAAKVVESGARGATIGRNIWGVPQITEALLAFKAVIHDGKSPREALETVGLAARK
jgi:class I fructose-bisphosphate aldolase